MVKQASIDTIEELQNLAYILMQYMIDCNQKRVEVSKTEIEELIEGDFISLDDYIFELKWDTYKIEIYDKKLNSWERISWSILLVLFSFTIGFIREDK